MIKRLLAVPAVAAVLVMFALTAGASARTLPVIYGAYPAGVTFSWHNPSVRPPSVWFGADGGLSVRSMRWHYWDRASAYGRGTRWANKCVPSCAAGNYNKAPASLTMWRVRWHNGQRFFSRMTMRWTTRNGARHKQVYSYSKAGGTELFWH
jgi:hypothetical protein